MFISKYPRFTTIIEPVILLWLLTNIVSVRGPQINIQLADKDSVEDSVSDTKFPIVLPNKLENGFVKADDANPCLLYAESVSVVVFDMDKKQSAWATLGDIDRKERDTDPEYSGGIKCPTSNNIGQEFNVHLQVKIDGGVPGYYRDDQKKINEIFTVNNVEILLNFNFTRSAYWQLVDATAEAITFSKGKLDIPNVDSSWKTVSGVSNNKWMFLEGNYPSSWDINGYKDYSFACARTSPVVWAKQEQIKYAVGVTINNMQFQLNATYSDKGNKIAKFGRKVADCAPLFNIGTLMGLIVALLLIGVLSFGFLMLNSVQTMDRFDDPKQKQLIINAKE